MKCLEALLRHFIQHVSYLPKHALPDVLLSMCTVIFVGAMICWLSSTDMHSIALNRGLRGIACLYRISQPTPALSATQMEAMPARP